MPDTESRKFVAENELLSGRSLFEHAIGNLYVDRELAFEFFVVFSRFEYALKTAGFVLQGENERNLQVDFDRFANAIAVQFQAMLDGGDPKLAAACEYYRRQPPLKQVWYGRAPDWRDALPQARNQINFFLVFLRRTRNNLFHGGKGWRRPGAPDRDNHLMRHGLQILEAMINCEPDVSGEYSTFE